MPSFSLEVVTPGKVFFSGEVEMAVLKTPDGELGVLKDHMPLVVIEAPGPLRLLKGGEWLEAILGGGFAEIKPDKTIVLTREARWKT